MQMNDKCMVITYLQHFSWCIVLNVSTHGGFLWVLVMKHLELLTAGHSHNSDPLRSADDGISNHDSLSKHLFCNHCGVILAPAYPRSSRSQHKMGMWCTGFHYQQLAGHRNSNQHHVSPEGKWSLKAGIIAQFVHSPGSRWLNAGLISHRHRSDNRPDECKRVIDSSWKAIPQQRQNRLI